MSSVVLVRNQSSEALRPFTLIREVADIRMGFFTFRERWALISAGPCRYADDPEAGSDLQSAVPVPENMLPLLSDNNPDLNEAIRNSVLIEKPWQISQYNQKAIVSDFSLSLAGKDIPPIAGHIRTTGAYPICIDKSAVVEHCFINSTEGPVFIGKNVLIMDGAMLRGPLFIGDNAVVKAGASIYGATTIGPSCIAGGEIKNSVFMGFSNKAHHGYIGDSVIGEWCNLGAGTTSSNLKNTAGKVKVWNMHKAQFDDAGNKCGLLMGDFSRAAINTSFNTGTMTGVCANVFDGQQLTPKFIPDFSWGSSGLVRYELQKAIRDIRSWMAFKNQEPSLQMIQTLTNIYQNQFNNQ